jgi:hypothetical protein
LADGAWHPQSPLVHARAQAGTLARCALTLDYSYAESGAWGATLSLVLHRTDGAHRRVVYSLSRQSRLHLNLIIKNGERGSLRGAFGVPRIYERRFLKLVG